MDTEKKIGFLTGLILMAALGIAMALVATLATGAPLTLSGVAFTALCAFAINFAASLIIPANKISNAFALKLGAEQGTFKHHGLRTLMTTLIYVTIVSFGMTLINVGFTSMLWMAWLSLYPILFVAGFIVALLLGPVALRLAQRMAGA